MSKIGLLAGCINKQQGIERKHLFHSLLCNRLDEAGVKEHDFPLGYYTSYDKLVESAKAFIHKKVPETIFLFLRPYPLMALNKPVIKYKADSGRIKHSFHPRFANNYNTAWPSYLTNYTLDAESTFIPKPRWGLRDFNLLGGVALGINQWSSQYINTQISAVKNMCKAHSIGLKVLSIPEVPVSIMSRYVCTLTNKRLRKHLNDVWVDLGDIPRDHFMKDGMHYSEKGHKFLAETVFNLLSA